MKRLWTDNLLSSRRIVGALACGVCAVLLTAASPMATDDGAVVSLSVVPTSGRAQVMIGVNGDVSVKDFVLHDPERIVVDITGATIGFRKDKYDHVVRGGVLDVRYAQNQPNVVRVVLTLAGPRKYEVIHGRNDIKVLVDGGGEFDAWSVGGVLVRPLVPAPESVTPAARRVSGPTRMATVIPPTEVTSVTAELEAASIIMPRLVPQQPGQAPRINITFENASITDVLSTFANFSGRTILPAKGVTGTVSAEIKDQPWDVAFKAILNANGFDAVELPNGIIIVNTLEALAAQPALESLITRTVRLNYTRASAVAEGLRSQLTRDCSALRSTGAAGVPAANAPTSAINCPVRGTVTADSITNSVTITDSPSAMENLIQFAQSLDVRQPQVNIKAKIILVDRTQLEGLGLKYDLGSRTHHFNDVISRVDSAGNAETANVFTLGGNAVAAIANAAQGVGDAALQIVYSTALGGYDFTTFLEALQQTSLLDVQAEPSVTTLNNRRASLSAGTQVPVRTTEPGTGGNAGGAFPQVTVSFRQTGIVLEVTPTVTSNRQIQMRIHAENSEVDFRVDGAVFPTQVIENELLVADGETAVMGGLTQTSVRYTKTGIPLLVELPLIGRLFGVTNRQETKRDLLILITPHIVDEGDMTLTPRRLQ